MMLNSAELIRSKRTQLGLSQSQLAYEAGVSLPTIQNAEAGKANLSQATLENIFEVLGFRIEAIPKSIDWDIAVQFGVPLTSSNDSVGHNMPQNSNEFLFAFDYFLKSLPLRQEVDLSDTRNWEAFTAFLWALETHYSKSFKRSRYFKKANFLLKQNIAAFSSGRLIKLRRIALVNLGGFL